jgi:hypothetical protein
VGGNQLTQLFRWLAIGHQTGNFAQMAHLGDGALTELGAVGDRLGQDGALAYKYRQAIQVGDLYLENPAVFKPLI